MGIGGNINQANYAAAKAGIIGFTKTAVKEFGARNIRMNVVAPGFIATEMTGEISEQLSECADVISDTDAKMQEIYKSLFGKKTE